MDIGDAMLMCSIITTIVICIGLIGNVLSFIVFSRKTFNKLSLSFYGRALSIFDSFMFSNLIFQIGTVYITNTLLDSSSIACKINNYIAVGFSPVSGWILVVLSIDQLINVSTVRRFQFMNEKKVQLALTVLILAVNLSLYVYAPINLELVAVNLDILNKTINVCSLIYLPHVYTFQLFYLVEANLVPFCLLMITTALILRNLRQSTHNLKAFADSRQVFNMRLLKSKQVKQRKFALNSVFMNVLFVLLTTPCAFGVFFQTGINDSQILLMRALYSLFFLNYSSHFFIHLFVNSVFRREFLTIVGLTSSPVTSSTA